MYREREASKGEVVADRGVLEASKVAVVAVGVEMGAIVGGCEAILRPSGVERTCEWTGRESRMRPNTRRRRTR